MQFLKWLKPKRFFVVAVALVCSVAVTGWAADISAVRSWRAPDNTRLVLDLSAPVAFRLSAESSPARIIVEIDDSQTTGPLNLPTVASPLKSIRLERQGKQQRLVIDTVQEVSTKLFQLPPNEKYGQRLVIDLFDKPTVVVAVPASTTPALVSVPTVPTPIASGATTPDHATVADSVTAADKKPVPPRLVPTENRDEKPITPAGDLAEKKSDTAAIVVPEKYDAKRYRNIIVAIDAGHGGEDPGAIGMKKTHEKDVTLAIAKEIKSQMDKEPGLTAVLTRTGDYFIPLPDRRRLARYQHKADIFVSIHADAAENRSAKGASVFALSLKGAGTATSRFAQMLAERENRSDLIGGAIEKDDDVLRNVLADMVVAGSLEHSLHMGRFILNGLDEIGSLHSKHVEQAGFAVLKEPGMVSLLVETGFISNPEEEKKLIDTDYQQKIAQSVLSGIRRYAQKYPSPGTYFAWQAEQGRSDGVSNNTTANKVVAAALPNVAPLVESQKQEPVKPSDKAVVKKVTIKHKVVRGENLTKLAAQYQVSLSALRDLNNLQDDNVKIGQVLKIPTN